MTRLVVRQLVFRSLVLTLATLTEARPYNYPQISLDGSRIAMAALGESADIWMLTCEPRRCRG